MTDTDVLTTDQLRERLEKVWLKHIKLCQDNFLYFVKNVWPDFICRTDSDPDRWGHHQHIAHEFTNISKNKNFYFWVLVGTSMKRGATRPPCGRVLLDRLASNLFFN